MSAKKNGLWGQEGYVWDWTAGWLFGLGTARIFFSFIIPWYPNWVSAFLLAAGLVLSVVRASQIRKLKRESPASN